ncbi:MAG: hypothetical protein PVI71_18865 [Desulfobacterales bacterium]|jgi:hypothetical protein
MKDFISQGLFLLSEIGVIVVMLIIIIRERRKRKESQNKVKRHPIERTAPNQQTLYLD